MDARLFPFLRARGFLQKAEDGLVQAQVLLARLFLDCFRHGWRQVPYSDCVHARQMVHRVSQYASQMQQSKLRCVYRMTGMT